MADAFIYDHVRTPRGRGKADGSLHEVTALALATHAAAGASRTATSSTPAMVDDVVMGCVDPVGEAGGDIARMAALSAGYGDSVPGMQINRFCASGLDAVNFAAAQVMSGQHSTDHRRRRRIDEPRRHAVVRRAWPMDPSIAVPSYFMPQGISADLIATKYGFSRDDVDAYAVESQKRAAKAWDDRLLQELRRAGEGHQRPHDPGEGRAHAPRARPCSRWRSSSRHSCRWARWAGSTPSPCRTIPRSRASIMSIMPATRPASSTARPRC